LYAFCPLVTIRPLFEESGVTKCQYGTDLHVDYSAIFTLWTVLKTGAK
jgi:hypothetical protein